MQRRTTTLLGVVLFGLAIAGAGAAEDGGKDDAKVLSGMSVIGNDEAPKSLVIVPWKSSKLGETLGVSRALDDSRGPIDRRVLERALHYHDIRSAAGAETGD